jgi:hypothetical protein
MALVLEIGPKRDFTSHAGRRSMGLQAKSDDLQNHVADVRTMRLRQNKKLGMLEIVWGNTLIAH